MDLVKRADSPLSPMPSAQGMRSIAEVERETSLPRATLRIWERRYGFPEPERDHRGERIYPDEQVAQLQLMRALLEQGHRPAKLLAGGAAEIRRLAAPGNTVAAARPPRTASPLLAHLLEHDGVAVRHELEARLKRDGLAEFVGEYLPVMNRTIGDGWSRGDIQVHEEHLYSDCVYQVLRGAIAEKEKALRPEAPQVLLTTFPQEYHGLGLLMAQAIFAMQGCRTISLGLRLPIDQIAAAVRAYRADLLGLSFTASLNPAHVLRGLEELRGLLPVTVRIWAGGDCPALKRRGVPGVRVVSDVRAIPDLLAEDFALPPRG